MPGLKRFSLRAAFILHPRKLLSGARAGLYVGLGLSVYAVILLGIGAGGQVHRVNFGIVGVLGVYLIGGPLAGVLVVLCRPLARSWLGWVGAATLICIPLGLMIAMVVVPTADWYRALIPVAGIWAIAFGPLAGTLGWFILGKDDE